MSLPPQWQKWAIPLMQYGVRFSELGYTGDSNNRALPRQKSRHHGNDQEEGSASERKLLAYSRRQLLANAAIAASRAS